jgi:cytosine/adenosine deaminase-related metal-dependent hydrolase
MATELLSPTYIHIKNASVITVDTTAGTLSNCDVLLENDVIRAIGPNLDVPSDGKLTVIDATNCIVVPGFVDGHHHLWQHLIRGVATDWSLFDYLVSIRSLYGSVYTADDVELAYYAGAVDLLNNGVTCILEHSHIINSPEHADAAIRGLKKAGIRGCFCYGFYENPPIDDCHVPGVDLNKFDQAQRVCDARRVREVHFSSNDPAEDLLTFGIAPTEPESQPLDETVRQILLSRELGARITTMHVAMGPYDTAHQEVVQHLANGGILGPDLVFSHGASLTDSELDSIRSAGAGLVGTPDTELQMGMGFPAVFRATDKGCNAYGLSSFEGIEERCQVGRRIDLYRSFGLFVSVVKL